MAVQTPPIFLQSGSHPAEDVRRMLGAHLGQRGGIVQSGDLATTQNGSPDMSVNVATGAVFIPGTEATYAGMYYLENRGTLNVAISAAHATLGRRDLIVAKVQDTYYSGATNAASIVSVTGTAASSPADPTVPENAWVLARVTVDAAVTTIVNAKITDLRTSFVSSETQIGQQTRAPVPPVVCTTAAFPTVNLSAGLLAWTTDTDQLWRYGGSTWGLVTSYPSAWTAPTLQNSWVNYGGAHPDAQYRKIGDMVQLRGDVKNGTTTAGTNIFTLPTGYRPPKVIQCLAFDGANALARFDVNADGTVWVQVCANNGLLSLNAQFSVTS